LYFRIVVEFQGNVKTADDAHDRSMHYERAALLSGVYRGDVGQESEEKIGKSAEE
jgi:hypothetical protein